MKALLIWAVLVNFYKLLKTSDCTSTHDQVLSIKVTTNQQADIVRNISSQYETVLWSPASPEHIGADAEVHLFVPANNLGTVTDLLRTHHITHQVLLDNTEELIEMQTRNESADPRSSTSYYERYHSLEDIYYWINKTAQEHSDMVKVILIGSSYEKRPLYVLKLSGRQERAEKRAMWVDCGIHAREWISPAFCLWFVQYTLNFYNQNNDITEMLNGMDIYVLPVMNPDGYKYTWTTVKLIRCFEIKSVVAFQDDNIADVVLTNSCVPRHRLHIRASDYYMMWLSDMINTYPVKSGKSLQCSQSGMPPVPSNMSI